MKKIQQLQEFIQSLSSNEEYRKTFGGNITFHGLNSGRMLVSEELDPETRRICDECDSEGNHPSDVDLSTQQKHKRREQYRQLNQHGATPHERKRLDRLEDLKRRDNRHTGEWGDSEMKQRSLNPFKDIDNQPVIKNQNLITRTDPTAD